MTASGYAPAVSRPLGRATSAAILAGMLATTLAALLGPWWFAAVLGCAVVAASRQRVRAVTLVLAPAATYALLLGVGTLAVVRSAAAVPPAMQVGAAVGLRLGAALAVNLAVLAHWSAERLVEGLRLPPRVAVWPAAVAIAAHDVARDLALLVQARRLEGDRPAPPGASTPGGPSPGAAGAGGPDPLPDGRHTLQPRPLHAAFAGLRRVWWTAATVAAVTPALLWRAMARATTRRDALRQAGFATGSNFVPLVAVAALVTCDRLLLVALPNVKLSYVVAFASGLLWGPWTGAAASLLGMALSDFALSGLLLPVYVNAPALALVAILGGAARPLARHLASPAGRASLALLGAAATLAFSAAVDVATWALVPETRGRVDTLRALVLAGLVFNLVPAAVNAALFASAVPAVLAARPPLR